jgi:hypothetical protein
MFKTEGLDQLKKKADQLSSFSQEIVGELAHVSFDPSDPASIEAAIQGAHDAIDQNNAILDLQQADYDTYDRPLRKLEKPCKAMN